MPDLLYTSPTPIGMALDAWLGSGTPAVSTTLKVMLFTNQPSPSPAFLMSDLTPATFTGYAPATVTVLGTAGRNGSEDVYQECSAVIFQPVDAATPNTIRGWALYSDQATDVPITLYIFDVPVALNDWNDTLVVQPRIMIGQPDDPMSHN